MVTKRHCDYCDNEVNDIFFVCTASFGFSSKLDDEHIECCSDICFLNEIKERYEKLSKFEIMLKNNYPIG